ncbi:MAG: hypothetical protein ABII96_10170 [Candidatus Zixiibacteriota bacterium]
MMDKALLLRSGSIGGMFLFVKEYFASTLGKGAAPGKKGGCRHCVGNSESIRKIKHVRLERYFASVHPMEAEVVNYADKRVLHDRVVPLGERMGYILEKYGRAPERKRAILLLWEKTEALEARLFAGFPFALDDINSFIGPFLSFPRKRGSRPAILDFTILIQFL